MSRIFLNFVSEFFGEKFYNFTVRGNAAITIDWHTGLIRQMIFFDPLWIRDPNEYGYQEFQRSDKKPLETQQLRHYLGPELVKSA
jgi:hypothetical protein